MNRNTWIIIVVAVIVMVGLIWIFNRGTPTKDRPTSPDNPTILIDVTTGCQFDYLSSGRITPHLDSLGYPVCEPSRGQ